MTDLVFGALIPAAGASSRMGGFKPLIELGGQSLVQRAVSLFLTTGVTQVVVVAGHRAEELIPALEETPCRVVVNRDDGAGEMLSSIQAGARELRDRCEAFFVLPVDIPLVRRLTIRRLVEQYGTHSALVCHPTFGSKRGHPPLIDAALIEELLTWHGGGGLKGFLDQYADRSVDVPVADAWTRRDVDTDEDIERMRRDLARYAIPTRQECEVMLEHYLDVPEAIRAHGRKVADVAGRLGEALNAAGGELDLGLLEAAGLLHDAFKSRQDHAAQAGAWLMESGFKQVAAVVDQHMDLAWKIDDGLNENALVYLADKVTEGDRVVTITERREGLMDRYGHDDKARRAIRSRLDMAAKIQYAVEKKAGQALESILRTI